MPQRRRVLAEPDAQVAIQLKSNPGQWYAISSRQKDQKHTLSQVAYRIRKGQQSAFRCSAGVFETTVVTDETRTDPVELLARYVPNGSDVPETVSA